MNEKVSRLLFISLFMNLLNFSHIDLAYGSKFEELRVEHKRTIAGDKVLVTSMAESKTGVLFIGSTTGLYKIDGVLEEKVLSKSFGNSSGFITSIAPIKGKALVSVYGEALWLLDERGQIEEVFEDKRILGELKCHNSSKASERFIFFACEDTVLMYDHEQNSIKRLSLTSETNSLGDIVDIVSIDEHNLFLLSQIGGVISWQKEMIEPFYPIKAVDIESRYNSLRFYNERMFLSSTSGIEIIDLQGKLLDRLSIKDIAKDNFPELLNVSQISENKYLVSSFANGVFEWDSEIRNFSRPRFYKNVFEDKGMNTSWVNFKTKRNELFFSTQQGGLVIIPRTFEFLFELSDFSSNEIVPKYIAAVGDKHLINDGAHLFLLDDSVLSILKKSIGYVLSIHPMDGNFLVSTVERGVELYDSDFTLIDNNFSGLPIPGSSEIKSIYSSDSGRIYAGAYFGEKRGLYSGFLSSGFTRILPNINVNSIFQVDNEVIVFANANKGFEVYSFINGKKARTVKSDNNSILYTVEQIGMNEFILGTKNNGILKFNYKKNQILNLELNSKLKAKNIRDFTKLGNNLIISSAQGLFYFDLRNKTIVKLGSGEGVTAADFPLDATTGSDNKRTVLPTTTGAFIFDNKQFSGFVKHLESNVTKVRGMRCAMSDRKHVTQKELKHMDKVELSYNFDYINCIANHDNFADKHLISLEYSLSNKGNLWSPVADNQFRLNTLPTGEYILKLRATNPLESNKSEPFIVWINVLKPWWLSSYAIVAYLLSITAFSILFYLLRTNALKNRNIALEKTVAERTSTIKVLLDKKRAFFANVSHEFRTPLALISGPVNIIEKESNSAEVSKQVSIVKRNTNRLVALVDQILELAKLETSKTIPNQIYDVQDTVNLVCSSFESLLDNKKQSLVVSNHEKITAELLQDSLEKILINLLINAYKYCPDNSQINVCVAMDTGRLRLDVADNGPGIAEEQLEAIFERFTRLNQGEDIQGSGIGLALVKELVEANGGTIEVQSIVGSGTNFVIYLPIIKQDSNTFLDVQSVTKERVQTAIAIQSDDFFQNSTDKEPTKSSPTLEQAQSYAKPKLLIVEDNADLRTFIRDILVDKYDCYLANNGEEGVSIALELVPNVILSDVLMPKMDGFELAHAIRDEELICHVPLILLTAKGDDESRMKGWRENVDDFIAKPFNPDELHLRIERLLSIREIMRKKVAAELGNHLAKKNDNPISFQSKRDLEFFNKFEKVIESHYADEDFNRSVVASALALSERQLNRKLSAMMDYNFAEYLRKFRLQKAHDYILQGRQITEVAYDVGFASPSYFASCFKAEFGLAPKEYVEQKMQEKS